MLNVLNNAVPVSCWACSVSHNDSTLFCPHCSKIQPPPGGDYFSVFGMEPHLELDGELLEREFHRLSRRLHPDRFARAADQERVWSLADTALINDAYRTLKDPLRRTEYLLKLTGRKLDEGASASRKQQTPPDLLEEFFELNMQLEEMRMNAKMGEQDEQLTGELKAAKEKYTSLLSEVDSGLRAQWKLWDAGDEATREQAQNKMLALLDRRRFLANLVRDVNEVLGAA